MINYITDKSLKDGEMRVMIIISELLGDKEYLELKNGEIGEYIGKSASAIAKLVHRLLKKGYIRTEGSYGYQDRKLYILK